MPRSTTKTLTVRNAKAQAKVPLRPLADVLEEMRRVFGNDGIDGVEGFVINVRTTQSTMRLEWGDIG